MTAFHYDNFCEKSKHNKFNNLKINSVISVTKSDILS